jgi:hypothetical protein
MVAMWVEFRYQRKRAAARDWEANMRRHLLKLAIASAILVPAFATAPAHAQATRTWVSGVGDDVNPCSRTAPCKTFAGAISKTAANGKINCLDPGGFGAVTITKSIEIDCFAFPGGILNAGTNGVNVSTTAGIKVVLRGIEIHGGGTGVNGVNITVASEVTLDKCFIIAQTGSGVQANVSSGLVNILITDTNITQVNRGVLLSASGTGASVAQLNNVAILNPTTSGVETNTNGTIAHVHRSAIGGSTAGSAVFTSAGNGQIAVSDSMIFGNSFGIRTVGSGSKVLIRGNSLSANSNSISIGAGTTVASGADNKVDPPGTAPNATWTQQ